MKEEDEKLTEELNYNVFNIPSWPRELNAQIFPHLIRYDDRDLLSLTLVSKAFRTYFLSAPSLWARPFAFPDWTAPRILPFLPLSWATLFVAMAKPEDTLTTLLRITNYNFVHKGRPFGDFFESLFHVLLLQNLLLFLSLSLENYHTSQPSLYWQGHWAAFFFLYFGYFVTLSLFQKDFGLLGWSVGVLGCVLVRIRLFDALCVSCYCSFVLFYLEHFSNLARQFPKTKNHPAFFRLGHLFSLLSLTLLMPFVVHNSLLNYFVWMIPLAMHKERIYWKDYLNFEFLGKCFLTWLGILFLYYWSLSEVMVMESFLVCLRFGSVLSGLTLWTRYMYNSPFYPVLESNNLFRRKWVQWLLGFAIPLLYLVRLFHVVYLLISP